MAATSLLGTIGRWFLFAGVVLWLGAVGVRWILLPLLARRPHPGEPLRGHLLGAAASVGLGAGLLLVAGTLTRLQMQVSDFVDPFDPPGAQVHLLLTATFWGRVWIAQAATVAVGALGFALCRSGARWAWVPAGAAALAVGLTLPLSGHAVAVENQRSLAVVADALHVWAAGIWLGGLAVMLFAVVRARRHWQDPAFTRGLADLFSVFSPLALGCAAAIATTGLLGAWLHLPGVGALVGTGYGRALMWKLAAVAAVTGVGAYNWRRVGPSVAQGASPATLLRSAGAEVALASLVLLLTAVLVVTSPP